MECEKFEPLLIDELYEELDEVTSAAVKRHVSGCSNCGSIFNGMKATRRLAALPMVAAPVGLEDRILAAVREQQKIVPIQSRMQRTLSLAGKWAMKPQTAMAAVFLLMIGSSAFLIRNKKATSSDSAVSVEVQGRPDPIALASAPGDRSRDRDPTDSKGAATSHGPSGWAYPPSAAAPVAMADKPNGPTDELSKAKDLQRSALSESEEKSAKLDDDSIRNAGAVGGAAVQSPATVVASKSASESQQDGFSSGMASYRARNYVEATRQFDTAASAGDPNAALWAAKSVKDGNGGCSAALKRFEAVTQKSPNTWQGSEAQLEAARCLISQGQTADARTKLNALSKVQSHQQQAQDLLKQLDEVATRRESGGGKGGAASPARNAAPAPMKKAAAAPKPASEPAAADKAAN